MADVLTEGSPDELIKSIEREQNALTTFLAERAELTDDDRTTLAAHNQTLKSLRDLASSSEALNAFRDLAKQTTEAKNAEVDALNAKAVKSLTEQIWDDEHQRAYLKSKIAPGRSSEAIKVDGLFSSLGVHGRKNLVSTSVAGQGAELLRAAPREILDLLWRPTTLLDLVDKATSDYDSLEWVETIFTNNAAEVEEATALVGTSGIKPDSDNEMVVRVANAVTIAHLKHATERALRNRGELARLIETELTKGLDERIDLQIAAGNGVGPNMLGVLATSGTQAQPFVTDMITTLVKARTKVSLADATGSVTVVMNPLDYENLLLTVAPGGGYLFAGALFGTGSVSILGMNFVQSRIMPVGVAIVADWSSALLQTIDNDRIAWTDSHQDYFARNIRSCRAEIDVLFRIQRPAQFVVTDLV